MAFATSYNDACITDFTQRRHCNIMQTNKHQYI